MLISDVNTTYKINFATSHLRQCILAALVTFSIVTPTQAAFIQVPQQVPVGMPSPVPYSPTSPIITSPQQANTGPILNAPQATPTVSATIERDLEEIPSYKAKLIWLRRSQIYREALQNLSSMNPDSFSLTRAVFIVENAFMDNTQSFEVFNSALEERADLVKQILKREGLDTRNALALNYGIQKLFTQSNLYQDTKYRKSLLVPPFRYDFDDIEGDKDYTKMFVSKLLSTGTGQCHSMPLLYLLLAERLHTQAWLSLSPQHSYIQFKDNTGRLYNFETTNGNLVSNNWIIESGFVTSEALQQGTYLDTLSHRQLYAETLADLLNGYLNKFGYDPLAESIKNRILQINPQNLVALIVDANVKWEIFLQKLNKIHVKPKPEDLPKYPEAYSAYIASKAAYDAVDNLGYQNMPPEAYQAWLSSIEQEKKKQSHQVEKEKLRQEINQLRSVHSTLIKSSKPQ